MEENVISDAVNLAKNIQKSLLPRKGWEVVNIAIDDNNNFKLDGYPKIGKSKNFGYKYDNTPILLRKYGVIEAETLDWWVVGSTSSQYLRNSMPEEFWLDEKITDIARKKGYIDDNEMIQYYYSVPSEDSGPKRDGQQAILVNKQKLDDFIIWYTTLTPRFNDKTNCLEFLGKKVLFKGKLERKSLSLLLKNLNEIVSYKEFYELRGKSYQIATSYGKDEANERSRTVFKEIRRKINTQSKYKGILILKENEGFQMIVDEKILNGRYIK